MRKQRVTRACGHSRQVLFMALFHLIAPCHSRQPSTLVKALAQGPWAPSSGPFLSGGLRWEHCPFLARASHRPHLPLLKIGPQGAFSDSLTSITPAPLTISPLRTAPAGLSSPSSPPGSVIVLFSCWLMIISILGAEHMQLRSLSPLPPTVAVPHSEVIVTGATSSPIVPSQLAKESDFHSRLEFVEDTCFCYFCF